MAKQILTRIKDELKAMQQSRDQEYIQTEIKWNNKRSFSVECFRKGDSDEIRDADGKGFCTAPSYIQLQSLMRGGD